MDKLGELSELIKLLKRTQDEAAILEERLKRYKEYEKQLLETDIPSILDSIGVTKLETDDGQIIEIADVYHARIPAARAWAAYEWLRSQGHGDLIRQEVYVEFAAGEDQAAAACKEYLNSSGYLVKDKESVHPSTLKAFVREQKEEGNPIPDELFGVYHMRQAKVKDKK